MRLRRGVATSAFGSAHRKRHTFAFRAVAPFPRESHAFAGTPFWFRSRQSLPLTREVGFAKQKPEGEITKLRSVHVVHALPPQFDLARGTPGSASPTTGGYALSFFRAYPLILAPPRRRSTLLRSLCLFGKVHITGRLLLSPSLVLRVGTPVGSCRRRRLRGHPRPCTNLADTYQRLPLEGKLRRRR